MSIWSILRRRNIRFNRRLHRRNKRKQFRYPDYRLLFRLRTISCTKMQDAEVLSQSVDQAAKSRALTEARIKAAQVSAYVVRKANRASPDTFSNS